MTYRYPTNWPSNTPELITDEFRVLKRLGPDTNPLILERNIQKAIDKAVKQFDMDLVPAAFTEADIDNFKDGIFDLAKSLVMDELKKDRKFKSGSEGEQEIDDEIEANAWETLSDVTGFVKIYHFELI